MSQHSHLYQNAAWRKRRAYQLAEEPLCRYCKELYNRSTPATVADHIEQHHGDEEKFFNGELQSLCRPCHANVKQTKERSGYLKGCTETGEPIDPDHHWHRGRGT